MTAATTTGVVPLPAGRLPCDLCGIAVRESTGIVSTIERAPTLPTGRASAHGRVQVTNLGRCADCRELAARGAAALAARPEIAGRLGSIASDRAVNALCAFAALGVGATDPPTDIGLAVRYLGVVGSICRWSGGAGQCADDRWSWLDDAQRGQLRQGQAAIMRARVEAGRPAAPTGGPPPADGPAGCLICGRGDSTGWTRVARVPLSALGARHDGGAVVSGYLCVACGRAAHRAGSAASVLGPTTLLLALLAHLAPGASARLDVDITEVDGLVGWAATGWHGSPPREPNKGPFAHQEIEPETAKRLRLLTGAVA